MGYYTVTDAAGIERDIEIAGDTPTQDELGKAQGILEEYNFKTYGIKPKDLEYGLGEETARSFLRGKQLPEIGFGLGVGSPSSIAGDVRSLQENLPSRKQRERNDVHSH